MKNKGLTYLGYALGLALLSRKDRSKDGNNGFQLQSVRVHGEPAPPAPQQPLAGAPHQDEAQKQLHPAADKPKGVIGYIKRTFSVFSDDDCLTQAAAIAYYTVFSLPPLLLLIIAVAGLVFGRAAVQHQLQAQIQGLVGGGAATQVETMVKSAGESHTSGVLGAAIGLVVLVFGATGAMVALQDALNKTWHVKPDPNAGGVKSFIGKRILSFAMILGIGFLLLVSLAVSAALSALGGWISGMLPGALSGGVLTVIWALLSLSVITVLFAAMFKFLPDAHIEWREVWVGSALTAVLFTVGKTLIGLYLGHSGATSAYGAAGSLMLIVLWIYYASVILLIGAEFTKIWASAHGKPITPEPGAVRVVTEQREAR